VREKKNFVVRDDVAKTSCVGAYCNRKSGHATSAGNAATIAS
jgi:hypothetical protein